MTCRKKMMKNQYQIPQLKLLGRGRFRSEKDETELDLCTVDLALMQEGPTSDVLWPKGFDEKKGWIQSKLVGALTKRN